ncbi:MAG: NAD(P)-dependent glycerol-3-phosphate dehydrogenase [Clostridia bacterium]|nr:NAD(P)-dependent glycerol-3-phosphate dehydrogenase [Clostridia bacterium]
MVKVSVLGSGGWGMALALCAYNNGCKVTLWSPFENEVEMLKTKRTNEKLLKGIFIPEDIEITSDLSVVEGDTITIIAVPSTAVRSVAQQLKQYKNFGIIVNVSKGFEKESLKRLSEVVSEELPESPVVALTGPSHAEEVARKMPTSIVAASNSLAAAQVVQGIMKSKYLKIYTSGDIIGAELGGALKNIIAIAAGICGGLGLGDNTRAALITRGMAEMARLGVCMGAKGYTFTGLTGIGDLIVTCMSDHSRNNRFGKKLGQGVSVKDALEQVGTVEGYYAAEMAHKLSLKYGIELPIISECYAVLYEGKDIKQALSDLMGRPGRSEH